MVRTPAHPIAAAPPVCPSNPSLWPILLLSTQDAVFTNTYGYTKDSAKADKELGDFRGVFFNAGAAAAAGPMEVRRLARAVVCVYICTHIVCDGGIAELVSVQCVLVYAVLCCAVHPHGLGEGGVHASRSTARVRHLYSQDADRFI